MREGDHTRTIEALAKQFGREASELLEFYLERVGIRSECMPVGAAEEWAVEDCRAYLGMLASNAEKARQLPSKRAACDADATGLHPQNDGRRDSVASGKEQIP